MRSYWIAGAALLAVASGPCFAQANRLSMNGSVSATATDNAQQTASDKTGDLITRLTFGLGYGSQSGLLRGSAQYTASALLYADRDELSTLQHALNAQFSSELVPQRVFVDLTGTVSQSGIDAFGLMPSADGRPNANTTEVAALSVSPRWVGRVADWFSYSLSGAYRQTEAKDSSAGDGSVRSAALSLSPATSRRLGWGLAFNHQLSQSKGQDDFENNSANASLSWRLDELDLLLRASGGREVGGSSASRAGLSGATWSLGADWQPSPRTSATASWGHRPSGSTHSLALSYRTPRTVWRVSSSRGLSIDQSLVARSLGTAADLFDTLFASETDPVKRAALVEAELARLGLTRNTVLTGLFLNDRVSIDERHELSAAWRGVRSNATLTLSHGQTSSLGDAAATAAGSRSVRNDAVSLALGHRLAPDLDAGVDLSAQRNRGDAAGQSSLRRSAGARLAGRFSQRSAWTLLARRSLSATAGQPTSENLLTATVTTQF